MWKKRQKQRALNIQFQSNRKSWKRWKVLSICLAIVFTALIGRLAYIQLLGHEDLSAAAYAQQQIVLNGADTRGAIYDRYGNPIAGEQQEYIYIIEDKNFDGETMNALNEVDAKEIKGQKGAYKVFSSETYSKEAGQRLINNSDAYILEAGRRYNDDQAAVHMIGYVNPADSRGASGLELQYDDELSMLEKKVSATANVNGELLQGVGLTITTAADNDDYVKEGITTTLDLGLQIKVEEILDECKKDGAIVVTKSDTGEIMAAASTPGFDPSGVQEHVESSDGELINKVTQGEYPPGSVFKIVVAAAALEAGVKSDDVFYCSGSETIEGVTVGCKTGGEQGHGDITFKDAFADSCNCAFIQIAQKTGARNILKVAENMGLGGLVLDGYPDEKKGNLMSLESSSGAGIANLALGQGENLTTPLQIAKITGIVANDGVDTGVYLVSEEDKIQEAHRCISSDTSETLQEMMAETLTSGTGRRLKTGVAAAAKTGSAESVQGGVEVVHGWITGFVPATQPEYVITVFVENGGSGSGSAGPLFAAVSRYMVNTKMIHYEVGV